ncbi:MAG: Hint domain-containing protein [Sulfitobacter sp.]
MAFISEIHYRTADVVTTDPSTYEFVEITLGPGENPADFVVSFYDTNGLLMDGAGDNIQATGVVDAEVTLNNPALVGVPDPENPGYIIYTITATSANGELINASNGDVADEANYIALTNTSTGTTDIVNIGNNPIQTLTGGAADVETSGAAVSTVGAGQSVQFDSTGANVSGTRTPGDADIICFCEGTNIKTDCGSSLIEDLCVGDDVMTLQHGLQKIRWIGKRTLDQRELTSNPKLYPIQISKGALGGGVPTNDLIVSRQHRMLVTSPIAKRMFDEDIVLVAAHRLTKVPGIRVLKELETVTYFHILFDRHEIIYAENAPSESLFTGPEALKAVVPEAVQEISALFPEILNPEFIPVSAAYIPSGKKQSELVARHVKNNKKLQRSKLARLSIGSKVAAHTAVRAR